MSKKPGVMIYFELQPMLERLSDKHAGILFRAILEYGLHGTVPVLPDKLYLLWPIIQMRLDTDDQHYHETKLKKKYAVYVRWANHEGTTPMAYEEWLYDQEQKQTLYDD